MRLTELLTPDAVLVTAGQRLARHLAQQFAGEQRARGRTVWETPVILTYGAWLKRFWEDVVDSGTRKDLLLTPAQEAVLWEQVVAESDRGAQLMSAAATATLVADAWTLVHAWELPRTELDRLGGEDAQAFSVWAGAFETYCRTRAWLDSARLSDVLADAITQGVVPVPARLIVSGFDELTPQQQRLFDALRRAGSEISFPPVDESSVVRATRVALPTVDEEILAAARWARSRLDADPASRIGIFAPDLSASQRIIRRVFDDVLLPDAVLPGQTEVVRPYNLSLGEPLASQPPIAAAFTLLELVEGRSALASVSALLRSPYLGGADTELAPRAVFDADLRRGGETHLSLSTLAREIERARDDHAACPLLREHIQRLRDLGAALPRALAPSRWLARIAALLASMGWPGERALSSIEHQTVETWRELLGEFGALDAVLPSLSYRDALLRLHGMAQEKLFQRETPETPVQILGVFEASGLEFDAVWVMGLHDDVWPSTPRPNPFLPVALQRTRGLPHASAERELEFCHRLTQRLLRCAPEVVISHPLIEDDRDLRPSPLIRDLVLQSPESPALPSYRDAIHAHRRMETLNDEKMSALATGTVVHGGAGLFRAQAACPFRGSAEFRLGARELNEPEPGLSPADRGNLVHDLLAGLWQELGSHADLVSMPPEDLAARVEELADRAVQKLRPSRTETLSDAVATLERDRLAALVWEWLELEKQRSPFVVRREESSTHLSVAGVVTSARMDRVDELPNGDLVVIDYKTGEARATDWFGERPAEPQLPLYAAYGLPRERVAGVLYGRLRRGDSKYVGVARAEAVAPGVKTYGETEWASTVGPWSVMLEKWEAALAALADEIRAGQARVSPRDALACRYCHLHAMCRVHERRARLGELDLGEGDD